MPKRPPDTLPRMTVAEMVEDLRDEAEDLARELEGIPTHETLGGQAAQTLQELEAALTRIAEGAPDPRGVAEKALSLDTPLKPIGNADDTIRGLLRPRPS